MKCKKHERKRKMVTETKLSEQGFISTEPKESEDYAAHLF
jgi:hypothetical protein